MSDPAWKRGIKYGLAKLTGTLPEEEDIKPEDKAKVSHWREPGHDTAWRDKDVKNEEALNAKERIEAEQKAAEEANK
ncbi:MAG: hypothetical protein MMC23_003647 [Stictis urceolatum]|nr:hypothetical protein [Stictis urceolata]